MSFVYKFEIEVLGAGQRNDIKDVEIIRKRLHNLKLPKDLIVTSSDVHLGVKHVETSQPDEILADVYDLKD